MVEYGHGVGTGSEVVGGVTGGGSGSIDAGGNVLSMASGLVNDAAQVVAGLPPVVVAAGAAVLVLASLLLLRRVL
ncbi:MAG TPA: hypothetical protein VLA23_13045 [Candidatus Limnocylindrales bacterium]|nr:hypothetical protein [Candidatus Limnocylindrales bacterium]